MSVDVQMPKYRCHKDVWALKIKTVGPMTMFPDGESGCMIEPEDKGYGPFRVSKWYTGKHDPKPGGYFVQYEDGYQSYSPAKAFEEGYTRI
jgi:hypothetical protein